MKKIIIAVLMMVVVGLSSASALTITKCMGRTAVYLEPKESFNMHNVTIQNKSKSVKCLFLDSLLEGNFYAYLVLESYTDENNYKVAKEFKNGQGITRPREDNLDSHFDEGYVNIIGE